MERSGSLNRRVELWRKLVSKNTYGEYTESWSFNRYIRSYNHAHLGSQGIDNNEVFDSIRLRLTVRNQTSIVENDRLKVDGKMFIIDFIQPDDTRRWLHIRCSRINE
jgi:head-tail adaptor